MKLGRDVIFDYMKDVGVEYLFGVPGTNEIPLIDGTAVPGSGVMYVPCLHENIALGAAMGYARMSGRPGAVALHVTPGAAHSIGNLFNAYKSHVPLVVFCGQQHSELLVQEPLLASDLVQVARQYTKWAHEVRSADELPLVVQRAFKEALVPPMRPVFLSIPWDLLIAPVERPGLGKVTRIAHRFAGDREGVAAAAARLAGARNPVIIAGDGVGQAVAWQELERLANQLGAPVYTETQGSRLNYPNHLPHWQGELLSTQIGAQQQLAGHDVAFIVGFNAQAQVLVFRWQDGPIIPESIAQVHLHNDAWEIGKNHYAEVAVLGDIKVTLPVLTGAISAHPAYQHVVATARNTELRGLSAIREKRFAEHARAVTTAKPGDPVSGSQVVVELAALQEKMSWPLTLVNESFTELPAIQKYLRYDHPDAYFCVSGGSLGFSMPASLGIKLALGSSRTVVNVVGDGAALFYPHTWWTAAKFELPILYVILNNREYKVLIVGLEAVEKIYQWQPTGDPWYLKLGEPKLSFVEIARTFGVGGAVVSDATVLRAELEKGLKVVESGRPYVVEVLTDPAVTADAPLPRLDVLFASQRGGDDQFGWQARQLGPS